MHFDDDTTTLPAEGATTTETTSYDGDEVTPEQFHTANTFEAVTFLLTTLNAPEQVIGLFFGLIGMMAGRSSTVKFSRLDIGRRVYGRSGALTELEAKRIRERVSSLLSVFRDWIHTESLCELIKYEEGSKTEPNSIKTPILKWITELSVAAGHRLTPDSPDVHRRIVFEDEGRKLIKRRRLANRRRPAAPRIRRTVEPHTVLKLVKTNIRKYYIDQVAVSGKSETDVKSFLWNELQGFLERLHMVNPDDTDNERNTGGGESLENSLQAKRLSCRVISDDEPDYSDEASPFDMDEPFDLLEVTR